MKILIIEDERGLAESIASHLAKENFTCEIAFNFSQGEQKLSLYNYECAVVDLNLPGGQGFELVELLKKIGNATGIIIISARHSLEDKIKGFDIGADDYLTKPFHLSELIARVKSIIRRKSYGGASEIVFNEIRINFKSRQVFIREKEIALTRKEIDLLLYLIANKNIVLTKASIAEHLWGDNMDNADSFDLVYSQVKNLRRKLTEAGSADYIRTVYGIGYKFIEN